MELHTCQAHVDSVLPHTLPQPCAAVRPCAPIVLWKLGFPPSLNTACKTFSQMLFLFQGSCLSAASAMLTAWVLLQTTGCHVRSFGLSTAPKLSIMFLPVCWTSFCGFPNFDSNSISPFRSSTFSFYTCATPWISRNPEFAYISLPLRETLPLTYIAFIYHTFIHEMAVWRKCLTTCKSSVEDTHYVVPRCLPKAM